MPIYDPHLGKHFQTPGEQEMARQQLMQGAAMLNKLCDQRRQTHQRMACEHAELWEGIEPRSSVLISERASQAISPKTMTLNGQVLLDGLVLAIENGRARVQIHWLTTGLKGTATEMVTLDREEVQPLGHPFTWWTVKDLRVSAIRRSINHRRNDGWEKFSKHGYWEK